MANMSGGTIALSRYSRGSLDDLLGDVAVALEAIEVASGVVQNQS
jgi:hypothetical protein